MVNYQNGKIYKIESLIGNCCYYGSTTQTLNKRLIIHKCDFKKNKGISSDEILKYDDYKIILVENFPCNSKEELIRREGFYIRNNKCVNKCIAGRNMNEYRKDRKEHIKKINSNYYIKNKNKITEKGKIYRTENKEILNKKYICECGGNYTKKHKSTHNKTKKHKNYLLSIT